MRTRNCMPGGWWRSAVSMASTRTRAPSISRARPCGWRPMRAIQEARHRTLEARLAPVRLIGDAVISAFFAADKPKPREKQRAEVESWLTGPPQELWEKLDLASSPLRQGDHPIPPFHWQI